LLRNYNYRILLVVPIEKSQWTISEGDTYIVLNDESSIRDVTDDENIKFPSSIFLSILYPILSCP
jgi:hypothetical protein